jgi:hypothetical protein
MFCSPNIFSVSSIVAFHDDISVTVSDDLP